MNIKEMDEIFEVEKEIQKLPCSIAYNRPKEAVKMAKTIIDMLGDEVRILPMEMEADDRFRNCDMATSGIGKDNAKKYVEEFCANEIFKSADKMADYDRSLEISEGEDEVRELGLERWVDTILGVPVCYVLTLLNITEMAEEEEMEEEEEDRYLTMLDKRKEESENEG